MIKKIIIGISAMIMSGALMLSPTFAGDTDAWLNDWDYSIDDLCLHYDLSTDFPDVHYYLRTHFRRSFYSSDQTLF